MSYIKDLTSIYLVEDNLGDIRLIEEYLNEFVNFNYKLTKSTHLSKTLEDLRDNLYDVILLDLGLPDSIGFDTAIEVLKVAKDIPIIILTSLDEESIALNTLKEGIQDYIVKDQLNGYILSRSIRFAIERKSIEKKMKESEEKYRQLFEQGPDMILIIEPSTGQILESNNRVMDILGFSREEIKKIKLSDLEVKESDTEIEQHISKILKNGEDFFETQHRAKSGEIKDILVNVRILKIRDKTYLQAFLRDITQNKIIERKYIRESKRAESYLELAGVIIVALDRAGNITLLNKKGYEVLGYQKGELEGYQWFETCVPKDIRKEVVKLFDEIINGRLKPHEFYENPVITKDGKIKLIFWHNSLIFDDNGEINGTLSSGMDITEKKLAEEELIREKLFTETALNSQRDTFFVFDPKTGKATRWNKAFCNYSGYSDEEIKNLKAPESFYNKEDLKRAELATKEIKNTETSTVIMNLITKQGKSIPFEYVGSSINDDSGELKYIVSIGRDISERLQAEEKIRNSESRFRVVFDNASHGMALMKPSGKLLIFNEKLNEMLGYSKEELANKTPLEMTHPDNLEESKKRLKLLLDGEFDSYRVEKRYLTKDGKVFWADLSVRALLDKNGSITAILGIIVDINDRKKAEEKLKASEEKYRRIFEQSQLGATLVGLDYKFFSVNPKFCEILGYNENELLSMTIGEIIHPEYLSSDVEAGKKLLSGEISNWKTQEKLITKKNDIIWVDLIVSILYDENNEPIYYLSTIEDITVNKLAEQKLNVLLEKLKKEQERFKSLMEYTDEGFYLFETREPIPINIPIEEQIPLIYAGKVIECNDALARMYGFSKAKDLIGITLAEFHGSTDNPENIEFIKSWIKANYRIAHAVSSEFDKDGHPLWFSNNLLGIVEDGKLIRTWGTQIDITERKKAEEELKDSEKKFRLLFEHAPFGCAILDLNGKYIDVNQPYFNMVKMDRKELIDHSFIELFIDSGLTAPPYDQVNMNALHLLQKGIIPEPFELLTFIDGKEVWTYVDTQLIEIKDQTFILLAENDITKFKHADQKIKESEEKYREAYNRAEFYKDLFAHDMSNILQGILSGVELNFDLMKKDIDLQFLNDISYEIKNQVTRGAKLISNIRKLSRVEEVDQKLEDTDYDKFLTKSINIVKKKFIKKELLIEKLELSKKKVVKANELLLDIFENILLNSIIHNFNVVVKITIRISDGSLMNKNYIKFELLDNGMGIDDKSKKIIFQSVENKDKNLLRRGLGLYLVKTIIDSYGGKIWVEDRIKGDHSKGSNFIFMIPEGEI